MNFQDVIREVYDGTNKALKTTGSFSASLGGNVTLNSSPNHIGSVSIFGSITANTGMTTLFPGPNYIGLVTAVVGNNPVLGTGLNNIGFATVAVSTPTIYAVVNTGGANTGNITLNVSPNFIGLVTATLGAALPAGSNVIGAITNLIPGTGNTNLGASVDAALGATKVGVLAIGVRDDALSTLTPVDNDYVEGIRVDSTGSQWAHISAIDAGASFIGLVTVVQSSSARTITGNLTLSDSKGFIGLVTAVGSFTANVANITINPGPNQIGSVTVSNPITIGNAMVTVTLGTKIDYVNDSISVGQYYPTLQSLASGAFGPIAVDSNGRQFLGDPKGYIGLVTITGSLSAAAGNVTLDAGSRTGILGNLTLTDSKLYIGLTTTTLGASAAFVGIVTVANPGATGNVTIHGIFASRATQGAASISPTPVQLLATDSTSVDTFVFNISNTTIFISNETTTCNATVGLPIFLNDSFSYGKVTKPVFAATATGSGEIRFWRSLV